MMNAEANSNHPASNCFNDDSRPISETKSSERFTEMETLIKKWVHSVTAKSKTKVWEMMKDDFCKVTSKPYVLAAFKSMMDQLESAILEEIEAMIEANNVHQKLVELDVLCGQPCGQTWRPTGKPDEDIKAHINQVSQKEVEKLQKIANFLESQNQALNENSMRNDAQVQKLLRKIEVCGSNWKETASTITKDTRSTLVDALTKS